MSSPKEVQNQMQRFEEAARSLSCDEDEARFDAALRKVVRHKPVKDAPEPEKPDDGK